MSFSLKVEKPSTNIVHDQSVSRIDQKREVIASLFHRFAAFLDTPCWWYSEKVFEVINPIDWNSPVTELTTRTFYGLFAIPMIPVSIGLAAIGIVPRAIANLVQPRPFFYLKGESLAKKEVSNAFKVYTMNVCCIPGGFAKLAGGVTHWRERVDGLVSKILETKPDLVCLQEVNDINASYALYERLKADYAHFYFNIGSAVFTQNSGHFIASKYPIEDPNFVSFSSLVGWKEFVNKGLFSFGLKSGERTFCRIYAVHLSPGSQKKERKIEAEYILEKMKDSEDNNVTQILLGDMNTPWGTDEWKSSPLSKDDFYDAYNQGRRNVSLSDATRSKDGKIGQIIDYALLHRAGGNYRGVSTSLVPNTCDKSKGRISDHKGLLLSIPKGKME